jgi:hypothetical protein
MEWETVVVTRKVDPEREIDSQWEESHPISFPLRKPLLTDTVSLFPQPPLSFLP